MDGFTKSLVTIVSGLVIVCCAMASCTHEKNKSDNIAMTEMVKHGADPVAAKCAVKGAANSECAILAAKK